MTEALVAPISLCLITKNRIDTLEACINSARPFVAEINIYDTGSTADTLEQLDRIAAEPGSPIHIEHGEWRDDFSFARNKSFAMADPALPWWMWLDSDDTLLRGERLCELVAEMEGRGAPGALLAYDYIASGNNAEFQPFFRVARAHSVSWRAIVHEQWLFRDEIRKGRTSERLPELVVCQPPLMVRHRRHDHDPHRYTPLMRKAAEDLENNPRVYYFLAETFVNTEQWEDAIDATQRWLATVERYEGKWSCYRAMALAFRMQAELGLLRGNAAVATCEEILSYLRAWSQAAIDDPDFVAAPSAAEKANGLNRNDNDMIRSNERLLARVREAAGKIEEAAAVVASRRPYEAPVRPRRNDPCSCGSGKKSKRCCFA